MVKPRVHYHLPGLFEFYELYRVFLPLLREHREWFYDWCDVGSIYGAPADCIWGGGRVGFGDNDPQAVLALLREYGISARLTFSNSLLREEHLSDGRCNRLCAMLASEGDNGVIVHSDLLLDYLKKTYPELYFVSSTTKVLTDFRDLESELNRDEFRYVVPDFRLNKVFEKLNNLLAAQKDKSLLEKGHKIPRKESQDSLKKATRLLEKVRNVSCRGFDDLYEGILSPCRESSQCDGCGGLLRREWRRIRP